MKCQKCAKPATFHITDIVEKGKHREFHFCDEPSDPGRSYCATHLNAAYIRVRVPRDDAPPLATMFADGSRLLFGKHG